MKKLGLILITLILVAGMVFAAESKTSTVKVTGTIDPHIPDGGFGDGGLSIVGYVVKNNTKTPGEVVAYVKGDNDALVEDTSDGEKTSISVDILHNDANDIESLTLVFGAVCDMSPTATGYENITVSVTAGKWKLKKDATEVVAVDSLYLKADTKTEKKSIEYNDIKEEATLSWEAGPNGGISVTATPGANSNQDVVFIGYTNITWGESQEENAPAVTAGDYEADITISFDAK